MAIELHVRQGVLSKALTAFVQTQLFTLCGPTAMSELVVDHLDTVPGSFAVSSSPQGHLDLRLDVVVHTMTRAEVMAHPNAVPAMKPTGPVAVVIQVAVSAQALTVQKASSDASAAALPPLLRATLEAAIDTRLAPLAGTTLMDLAPVVAALESEVPTQATLGHAGGVVGLRLGSSGTFTPRLSTDQA